ncbi:GGDEF domain-containing response regulator [Salinibius halmophilus]|uniref:GGDEF domain-containing response regulator n=1 Tax=Salinibius halmophilus TaxID=1853216 RepID=UPI000E66597F|nr:diguanylate cyclase [Salinibius halmophilus]
MRVLVVDDNKADQLILSSILQRLGHEVILVDSGEAALTLLNEQDVDLVIMDEEMPGYSGHEVVLLLREQADEWLPVIFLSGNDTPEAVLRGITAGGDDYLKKPVDITILEAKMLAMRRLHEMRQELLSLNDELQLANEKLKDLSEHDPLTGLKNRRALMIAFETAITWCRRHNTEIALLMIDVDWFKKFNDTYGHQAGDACLQEVASRVLSAIKRSTDTASRYGGEEFCVLLPSTNTNQAAIVAEHIHQAIGEQALPHAASDFNRVTVSIGIAASPASYADIDQLFSDADSALYDAKRLGRNQTVVHYPDLDEELAD